MPAVRSVFNALPEVLVDHGFLIRKQNRRRCLLAVAAAGFLFSGAAAVLWACFAGPYPIASGDVLAALFGGPDKASLSPAVQTIVVDLRLSRSLLAWLVGVALAVSGCVFQGILQNPLADPFTIGVSTGAAFGASLALFFGVAAKTAFSLFGFSMGILPLAGLAGALLALGAVLLLSRGAGGMRRETLVLAGIVVATSLSACIALIKSLDEDTASSIVFWIMGSFQGRGFTHLWLFLPYCLIGLAVIAAYLRELDIMALGETQARQLGVDAPRIRTILLVSASLLTGACVSVAGVIGFVGLVVPHLVRMAIGGEHRSLVLFSGLAGGIVLLASDVAARSILPDGAELPVGVITALAGGPFFCLLLARKKSFPGGEQP